MAPATRIRPRRALARHLSAGRANSSARGRAQHPPYWYTFSIHLLPPTSRANVRLLGGGSGCGHQLDRYDPPLGHGPGTWGALQLRIGLPAASVRLGPQALNRAKVWRVCGTPPSCSSQARPLLAVCLDKDPTRLGSEQRELQVADLAHFFGPHEDPKAVHCGDHVLVLCPRDRTGSSKSSTHPDGLWGAEAG